MIDWFCQTKSNIILYFDFTPRDFRLLTSCSLCLSPPLHQPFQKSWIQISFPFCLLFKPRQSICLWMYLLCMLCIYVCMRLYDWVCVAYAICGAPIIVYFMTCENRAHSVSIFFPWFIQTRQLGWLEMTFILVLRKTSSNICIHLAGLPILYISVKTVLFLPLSVVSSFHPIYPRSILGFIRMHVHINRLPIWSSRNIAKTLSKVTNKRIRQRHSASEHP